MSSNIAVAMHGDRAARYDTPWRRLPWTGSLAILAWGFGIWTLSLVMARAPGVPERAPPIDARFIELPEPPAPPPPVVKPEPTTASRPHELAAPAATTTPPPSAAPTSTQSEPDLAQSTESPTQDATPGAVAAQPTGATRFAGYPGAAVRAGTAGVMPRPMSRSVFNEEMPMDDDGMLKGWAPGGWSLEYSDGCDQIPGQEGPCALDHFSQPPTPWCYNADPFFQWEIGTCKRDLDRAAEAYKHEDYTTAFAEFKKLALKDYGPAKSNLGSMYADGTGVEKDLQQAVYWWRLAAKDGDPKAIYNLALMYADGTGVAKDDQQAAYWFRKAAFYGFESAQYNFGLMYALGTGVPRDDTLAVFWYTKAAKRGNPIAAYNLGVMYTEGAGVAKDDKQSVYWYCKAAGRGNANAVTSLVKRYATGTEMPTSDELSYFCWLASSSKRAAQHAYRDRDIYERKLTQQQRDNAIAAARIWQVK